MEQELKVGRSSPLRALRCYLGNTRDRNFTQAKMQRRLAQIDEKHSAVSLAVRQRRSQGEAVPEAKITRLNEKIATLRQEIQRLNGLNVQMMQTEDKQISLTDPDARSMATSGRGSGVQSAVDTKHHLMVAHEVTNVGSDRSQLSRMTEQAAQRLFPRPSRLLPIAGTIAERKFWFVREPASRSLPKPMTSGVNAKGRFGKQDLVYVATDDVYLCPAGEQQLITTPMKKTARHCGAIGPPPAKAAH
jgi:hypothetical protein